MIKGPWPLSSDKMRYEIQLEGPILTPMFHGERVALRVSASDHEILRRGPGTYGVITDLDTTTGSTSRNEVAAMALPGDTRVMQSNGHAETSR